MNGLIVFVNPVYPSDAAEGQFKRRLGDAVIVDSGYAVQGVNHGNNPSPVSAAMKYDLVSTSSTPKMTRRHRWTVGAAFPRFGVTEALAYSAFLFFRQYDNILKQYVQAAKDEVEGVLGLLGAVEGVHLIFTSIAR